MGYGYYEINRFDKNITMRRGYGVSCKCHKYGCKEEIDRGLGFLCYNCGWYYCGGHLTYAYCIAHDEPKEMDCFAGEGNQVCEKCEIELNKWEKKYPCEDHDG